MPDYIPAECWKRLVGLNRLPCATSAGWPSYHCDSIQGQQGTAIYLYCHNNDIYSAFDWTMAVPKTWNTGPIQNRDYSVCRIFDDVDDQVDFLLSHPDYTHVKCACCCSCFAYGTPIMTPQGFQAIETLQVGAEVQSAAVSTGPNGVSLTWQPRPVRGSNGTPPAGMTPMVLLHFGADAHLVCTGDQIFLMPSGKVKRAGTLSVLDHLVDTRGKTVPVQAVKLVEYSGGVHHITTGRYRGELDGHLLEAAGVVIGDYALQSADLGDLLLTGPTIGTPDYDHQFSGHQVGVHAFAAKAAAANAGAVPAALQATTRLYTAQGAPIPERAGTFFTPAQSIDILAKASLRPFGDRAGIADLNYVFTLSRAFYPDIDFWLDWDNPTPTAYSFVAFGRKTVVVAGQMLRIEGLGIEAYAVIVGACIGRFVRPSDGAIVDAPMLPTVQADYYGVGYTMRTVWHDRYGDLARAGIDQVQSLFDMVTTDNAKGDPDDPLNDPSLDCRKMTLLSAVLGGTLPVCAGGQPRAIGLRLDRAQPGASATEVVLVFNRSLDPVKAADLANYTLKPAVALTAARVTDDPTIVALSGPFQPGTAYILQVANLTTADGKGLDDDHDVVRFVTAEP